MLNRILAVIRREYLERVRTKAFWISTLIVPVLLGAMMVLPAYLASRGGGEFDVVVIDLAEHVCPVPATGCPEELDGVRVRGDGIHYTWAGAERTAGAILEAVAAAGGLGAPG